MYVLNTNHKDFKNLIFYILVICICSIISFTFFQIRLNDTNCNKCFQLRTSEKTCVPNALSSTVIEYLSKNVSECFKQ